MPTEPNLDNELISDQVKKLMEKNAVTKRHQANQLSEILGLSFSHAHRKMKGESPWTIAQIQEVARHFGEPASTLFVDKPVPAEDEKVLLQEALLIIDTPNKIRCKVHLSGRINERNKSDYVASFQNDEWRIYPYDQALDLNDLYAVNVIEIHPRASTAAVRIAIVDDDPASANNLCEYLSSNGFIATAYYDFASFKDACKKISGKFDAYIIDWWVGEKTAEQCIGEIRESDTKQAPIILLTGELKTGKANESEINHVMRKYNVTCVEKPARLSFLLGNIEKELRLQ